MKVIKYFIMFFLSLILTILLILFPYFASINTTIADTNYFTGFIKKHNTAETVSNLMFDKLNTLNTINLTKKDEGADLGQSSKMLDAYKTAFNKNIDKKWLNNTINKMLCDFHSFFFNGSKLDSINIKPVKTLLCEVTTDPVLENSLDSNLNQTLNLIIDMIKKESKSLSDPKIKQTFSNMLLSLDEVKNLSITEEQMTRIIDKDLAMEKEGLTKDDILKYAIHTVVTERLDLNNMEDSFDTQLFISQTFTNEDNIIEGIRNLFTLYKDTIIPSMIAIIVLLLIIIAFISYNRKIILAWEGIIFIISGIIALISTLITKYLITGANLKIKDESGDFGFIYDITSSLINDIYFRAFLISAAFIILGIVMITVSIILFRREDKAQRFSYDGQNISESEKKRRALYQSVRIAILILLMALTVVILSSAVNKTKNTVSNFIEVNKNFEQTKQQKDIVKTLSDVLNAKFLN